MEEQRDCCWSLVLNTNPADVELLKPRHLREDGQVLAHLPWVSQLEADQPMKTIVGGSNERCAVTDGGVRA